MRGSAAAGANLAAKSLVSVACALALGAMAGPARAESDMTPAFGNTILSHYENGNWVKHFFDSDGSYRSEFSSGRRITGRWVLDGDRVCLTHIRPAMLLSRFCTPMVPAAFGQTWPARDPLGRRVQNQLVRGR